MTDIDPTAGKTLTFDEFREFLANALTVEPSILSRETSFFGDLTVESLKLVEMMLRLDTQLGTKIPMQSVFDIRTVGDAYDFYLKAAPAQPA